MAPEDECAPENPETPKETGTPEKPVISYPAPWGYKIVCSSEEEVRAHLVGILGDVEHELSVGRASSGGTYVTLNLKLVVEDEEHRLRIHDNLSGHDAVRFVL